jgi:hypothetical protein
VIHNWIPENIIAAVLGQKNLFSVLIATIVGVPIFLELYNVSRHVKIIKDAKLITTNKIGRWT